ncbi:MAG: heavy metal translocating P-type ATPase [Aphanocapsa sp. GSE-SYN-MK-11-07L]|jgi:Cu2+-exporting ATPase|nr:heavy metal translocating P-type ATPase [Aphanocapsa sp. GSE-SYN-MK-11-07L]
MEQSRLLSGSEAEQTSAKLTVALDVAGMRCAGCVQTVEKRLLQQPGVLTAAVNLVTQTAMVEAELGITTPEQLAEILTQLGFASQVRFQSGDQSLNQAVKADPSPKRLDLAIALLLCSTIGHLEQMGGLALPVLSTLWFHAGLATVALLGPGWSILREGWQGLRHGAPNMSTLISLGAGSAYLTSLAALFIPRLGWECFFDEPVMIIGFILLGRSLEERARSQTGESLRTLLSLQPTVARWLKTVDSSQTVEIPVQQVKVGDWLQVLPGDRFPVDGRLQLGQTLADESMLTGEAMPVAKAAGDFVMAGTLNQSGAVILEATRTGAETALAQIIALVEAAQMRKAPIQRLADTVASYFTYGVLAIATLTFLVWYGWGQFLPLPAVHTSIGHLHGMAETPTDPLLLSLKLAIAVLVVACPCALGLATPTAILVGTSLGAERGLLIRGGDVLERVQQLNTVVFDKTGTLTVGKPVVQAYWLAEGWSAPDLLQAAASVEQGVRHPLAEAILQAAQGLSLPPSSDYQTEAGRGAVAQVAEKTVCLGSAAWLQQQGMTIAAAGIDWGQTWAAKGSSSVYVAIEGACVGAIALTDQLRTDAVATVVQLQALGLKVMVLTGDQAVVAQAVLAPLGLPAESILANVRPEAKAAAIAQLQAAGQQVAMIGDGINDAPALAQANVGIALASGTDVAIEAAQIVLMWAVSGGAVRLTDVAMAIRLSRQTFRKIQQNLFWACAYNLIGIPVAAGVLLPNFGIMLSPAIAGGMMALSSICVVTNSLLLRSTFHTLD